VARIGGHLAVTSLLLILAGGCAASGPAGMSGRQAAQPGTRRAASAGPGWHLKALAGKYLAIAVPANRRLDSEVDSFTDHEHGDLAVAKSDLTAETATERWFDQHLTGIPFPPAVAAMVRALIKANQSRIELTGKQARSTSLTELRSLNGKHRAADAAVEAEVRLIRRALRLPPPSDS